MPDINEYIKKSMGQDINTVLNDFLLSPEQSDTNYNNDFNAKVVDNNDPGRLGRCRVRILSVHGDKVQDDQLPWALPDFGFVGSLKGSFIVPPIDAMVSVYFEDGDRYLPRYTRKVVDTNNMPTNKDEDYPDTMVFYETDNGDKFEINRKKKTTLFEHSSGTKFEIDAIGKLTITHKGQWEVSKSIPDPTSGPGPMCGLPYCLYTGKAHQATITTPLPGV